MFSLEKSRTDEISPKRAQDILTHHNNFEGQRPMRQGYASHLASAIKSKTMVKGHVALAENSASSNKFLVNGQHTLNAIVLSETTLKCTIDEYHYDNPDDLWKLFGTFDVGKTRSESDVMRAARGLFTSEAIKEVPLRILSVCGTALFFLGDGIVPSFARKAPPRTLKPELVQQYEKEVLFVRDLYADLDDVPNVAMATVIIATFRAAPKKSLDFWSRVIGGHDLVKGSPEWTLNRGLGKEASIAITAAVHRRGVGNGRYIGIWNLCIGWWNSFSTGKPRKNLRLASIKGLIEIES